MSERPTVIPAADVVLFAQAPRETQILLIQREHEPFAGYWALPGGHVDPGETFVEAAVRELAEETGLSANGSLLRRGLRELGVDGDWVRLYQVGVFDEPDRDPRGRVISVAFTAMLSCPVSPQAGDDARDARWMPLSSVVGQSSHLAFDHYKIVIEAVRTHTLPGLTPVALFDEPSPLG